MPQGMKPSAWGGRHFHLCGSGVLMAAIAIAGCFFTQTAAFLSDKFPTTVLLDCALPCKYDNGRRF